MESLIKGIQLRPEVNFLEGERFGVGEVSFCISYAIVNGSEFDISQPFFSRVVIQIIQNLFQILTGGERLTMI